MLRSLVVRSLKLSTAMAPVVAMPIEGSLRLLKVAFPEHAQFADAMLRINEVALETSAFHALRAIEKMEAGMPILQTWVEEVLAHEANATQKMNDIVEEFRTQVQ
jgi:hypothetical protein